MNDCEAASAVPGSNAPIGLRYLDTLSYLIVPAQDGRTSEIFFDLLQQLESEVAFFTGQPWGC
jgi:hypothetical protein